MSKIQFRKGDKVQILEAPLKRQSENHLITTPKGVTVNVAWNDKKAALVGQVREVHNVKENGLLVINEAGTEWLFHPDWVHFPGPDQCKCDLFMFGGCTCGRMNREKMEKQRMEELLG